MNKDEELAECEVFQDEKYQKWLIDNINDFILKYIINEESEYKVLEDDKTKNLVLEIIRFQETIKSIKEKLDKLKQELIVIANGEKVKCLNATIYPQTKTSIDYKEFLKKIIYLY